MDQSSQITALKPQINNYIIFINKYIKWEAFAPEEILNIGILEYWTKCGVTPSLIVRANDRVEP